MHNTLTKTLTISAALTALAVLAGSVGAQNPPPPPAKPGFLHNLFHHNKPAPATHTMPGAGMMGRTGSGRSGMSGMTAMGGGVVGNKNTHVYHLPGDKGALPALNNRVYFHSAMQAEASGYHRAGGASHSMRHPMMHGSPMHGTPMPMHGSPMHTM